MGNDMSQQVQGGHASNYGTKLDNDVKVTWKRCIKDSEFAPRDGHCAASVNKKLYIFGGVVQTADGDCCESNELLVYDTESQKWAKAVSKGTTPHARCSGTMAAVGDKLYLFGGLSQESGWTNDLHVYDTISGEWSPVEAQGNTPAPRDKVASAIIDKKMYIFGGFGPQGIEEDSEVEDDDEESADVPQDQEAAQFGWFNDLHIFDTESKCWSEPMQMNLGKPTARAAMGMCAVHKHLVIFGGRDMKGRCNDFHVYNTETRKWETEWLKETTGRQPEPRSFHTCTAVGNRVAVFGGRSTTEQHFSTLDIYDTVTKQWLQPVEEGQCPAGRGLHTANLVDGHFIVFGGSSDFHPELSQCIKYYNDVHSLTADELIVGGAIPVPQENQENISNNVPQIHDSKKVEKAQSKDAQKEMIH